MRSEILGAAACVCATIIAVKYFETKTADAATPAPAVIAAATPAPVNAGAQGAQYGREVRLPADAFHQYFVTAAVNRRPASFLIDTGASYVALRDSDARAAKIFVSWADYKHPVRTANGETKAAMIDIEAIEIDGIRVENVRAFILPDDQLSINLLGMSFLSRLESVEQRGGELVLKG
jgi:aspartyl protease family protein